MHARTGIDPWLDMPIDAKTYRPMKYGRVVRMRSGLGRVDPLPPADEVPSFYQLDAYYTQGESHFVKGDPISLIDKAREHLAWRADRGEELSTKSLFGMFSSSPRVLDVGCGDGVRLKEFSALGCEVAGLDPDAKAVERAILDGIKVHCGVAEQAASIVKGSTFDLIIMSHSLEHCIDPGAALASLRPLLADGGVLVIEVPNCAADHFTTFNIVSEMFDAPRHLWFFTPETLQGLLQEKGYRITRTYYHGFTRHFSNSWRATENRIRENLLASGLPSSKTPPPHSRWESTKLLARTMFAPPSRKYDCVGFLATGG